MGRVSSLRWDILFIHSTLIILRYLHIITCCLSRHGILLHIPPKLLNSVMSIELAASLNNIGMFCSFNLFHMKLFHSVQTARRGCLFWQRGQCPDRLMCQFILWLSDLQTLWLFHQGLVKFTMCSCLVQRWLAVTVRK